LDDGVPGGAAALNGRGMARPRACLRRIPIIEATIGTGEFYRNGVSLARAAIMPKRILESGEI
jgi:hypothetical protein